MGLECRQGGEIGIIASMFFAGFTIGAFFLPRMTDIYGRKNIWKINAGFNTLVQISALFIRNYYLLLVVVFINGLCGVMRTSVAFMYLMELTPKKRQPLISSLVHCISALFAVVMLLYYRYI